MEFFYSNGLDYPDDQVMTFVNLYDKDRDGCLS